MAVYQKCGVIFVTVILTFLQKIKHHNYRLYILYKESQEPDVFGSNYTRALNNTGTIFDGEDISKFLYQCLLVSNCLAVIPCLFLTSWSDKYGRKLLLMLPFIGSFASDVITLVIFFDPAANRQYLLISEGIDGLLGGASLMILGCLCYITDSTDHRQRTLSIAVFFGLYNMVPLVDMSLQYFSSPEFGLSFRTLFITNIVCRMVLAILFLVYVRHCVNESVFVLGSYQGNPWTNLVTPINVSDAIGCVFKRRLDNMRFYIVVLTAIFVLYTVSLFGNIITFPLYFRNQFLWPFTDILIFSAIFSISQSFVMWFSIYLASELHALDSDLGSIGCLSSAISCMTLTLAKKGYVAAIGALIGVGSLFVPVTIISVLSKLVERNETGSIFACIGLVTLVTQLIASTSYLPLNDICQEAEVPQLVFLLSFGLITFSLFFFIYLKKNISPHLLGHLNGSESLALINRKGNIEKLFDSTFPTNSGG